MKGLTLTQPWASLVACGAKTIETRSWSTSYRGTIAIHAGKGLAGLKNESTLLAWVSTPRFYQALMPAKAISPEGVARYLPRGCYVATAELQDVIPAADARSLLLGRVQAGGVEARERAMDESAFGDFRDGRFAWLLADIRPLVEPLPCRGAQGLRGIDGTIAREIRRRAKPRGA